MLLDIYNILIHSKEKNVMPQFIEILVGLFVKVVFADILEWYCELVNVLMVWYCPVLDVESSLTKCEAM